MGAQMKPQSRRNSMTPTVASSKPMKHTLRKWIALMILLVAGAPAFSQGKGKGTPGGKGTTPMKPTTPDDVEPLSGRDPDPIPVPDTPKPKPPHPTDTPPHTPIPTVTPRPGGGNSNPTGSGGSQVGGQDDSNPGSGGKSRGKNEKATGDSPQNP